MFGRVSQFSRGRFVDGVDKALEYWLGYAMPPVQRAVLDAQWQPDALDQYCQRCGNTVGPGESVDGGCAACRGAKPFVDAFIRLGSHADELREWVLAVKYDRWVSMALELGERLGGAIDDAGVIDPQRAVVIPMPMPWQRRIYRGIDHAHLIATGVAQQLNAPIARVLAKTHGPPQVTLSATDRQRFGGRNLRIRRRVGGWPLQGLHAVLVDDVRTTGTTLRRAARLLRQLDAPPTIVVAGVIAVSDPSARHMRRQHHESVESTHSPA